VDRNLLGARVLNDPAALKLLTQQIVYPLMAENRATFFRKAREEGREMVVIDIPLLFETGGEKNADVVVVASAPAEMQRARVLARPGMTADKFEAILAKQVDDAEKRARADFVVDTGHGLESARAQVAEIIAVLRDPARRPATRRSVVGTGEAGH